MNEEWKWIKGFEGVYQISNKGRIKSFHRDKKDGVIMSAKHSGGWYLTVLLRKNRKRKTVRVHQLVAEHFIGAIPKGYHVHHKDGNKQNNNVENLEIIHPKQHRLETQKQIPDLCKGMNDYNKYIKPKHVCQYDLDGHFLAEYVNATMAGEITGVCSRNILQVASKTPNKKGCIRKQAGGYIWKFGDDKEVV